MKFPSKYYALLISIVLVGCVPNVQNERFNISPISASNNENARIYFLNGTAEYVIPTGLVMSTRLSLNGMEIGGVNTFEIMAFDLKPGVYNFSVSAPNSGASALPKSVKVEAGSVNTLTVNLVNVVATQMFGLLGAAASGPRFEIVATSGLPNRGPKNTGYVKPSVCQDPCVAIQ